ncbi:CopG family transcriptional regulator, nickel-responsive regulator [Persephonella hydrogeniphila]|uniref:Putative nickel-responsive regulator n=1 Tax=Persephonella hydrogeniphila TaxID=198703 RepID=A0A285NGM2_9AQUI|nr:nickel-responsive transcriptional regulator NikR [Persephonella hydrogeniphila]SNZ07036.1 CopG family transcriptional regulator, nickel-responsive regulator [Persephonella hydrogeniphila]
MGEKLSRLSITIPEKLLNYLDSKVVKKGYSSRSEFIRDMIREKIIEDKWSGEEEVIGVLTVIYDHHQRELTQKMIDIQHSKYINVMCTTHVHLDHHNCLETIIIRGKPADIESISIKISGLKGVKFAKLTKTSKVEI